MTPPEADPGVRAESVGVGPSVSVGTVVAIRPPRHRLHRRFILWRTLNTFFWGVGIVGALYGVYHFWHAGRTWFGPLTLFVAGIFVVNLLFMPTYRYYVHRWELTDEAVYTLTGWISREWRVIPISRIQTIDTTQGPLEQLLRLATVKVTTASREGRITIEGLDDEIAASTVEQLNSITALTPGDAT